MARHDPCEDGHPDGEGSWPEYDARGIYLCRVCSRCERARLSAYRSEILSGYDQRDVDEHIEAES